MCALGRLVLLVFLAVVKPLPGEGGGCILTIKGCPIHLPLHGTLTLADGRTGAIKGALTRAYHYESDGRFICRGDACPARRGRIFPCPSAPAPPCTLDLSFHDVARTECECKGIEQSQPKHRLLIGGQCTCSANCPLSPCPPVLIGSHAEVSFAAF